MKASSVSLGNACHNETNPALDVGFAIGERIVPGIVRTKRCLTDSRFKAEEKATIAVATGSR